MVPAIFRRACRRERPWRPRSPMCGSGTAFSIQDVLLLQTAASGSQRFAGERSPRRRSTSPSRSCALRRRPAPDSRHNQVTAARDRSSRRMRGSFCGAPSRLSDDRALLGARLSAKLPGSILLRAALPEFLKPERHTLRGIGIRAVHGLNVEVGLCGVPGVSASTDLIAGAHPVTGRHLNGASLKVHESDVMRSLGNLDDDMIPEDRGQSPPNPLGLTQSVRNECQCGAARLVVGLAIVSRHHGSYNR